MIPGYIIALITFPGIIFHELGHEWFCKWTGVTVHEVCYFTFEGPGGYVIHERPEKFYQAFFITLGPFITGTLISLLIFILCKLAALVHPWLESSLLWLGISVAMHSFPSSTDANNLWAETNRNIAKNLWAIVGYPFVLFIYIANVLSFFWFDALYAGVLMALVRIFFP